MNPVVPMWFEVAALLPVIVHLVLFVLALISIGRSRRHTSTAKGVWVLVSILIPLLGPVLWFLIGRNAPSGLEVDHAAGVNSRPREGSSE
ncbi:PLD nuclease N-terminal domain-containing protein [Arthrobacter castelli]|uniref:PLD nuclease N-terminal domain-containing protein n=1 Tax=Arthrobacter castelli TaxID=271431 RepID=UPI000684F9C8|nr:PLD nuclease N-terminal domain-containing protein [Arthrobacter castelli]